MGFRLERFELLGDMVGDFGNAIASDGVGVLAGCLGGLRIARPAGGDRLIAVGAEELDPVVPRLGMQPQAMHKDNWILGGFVRGHYLCSLL